MTTSSTASSTPTITALRVIPVAGRDSMLLNLSGAHGPFFTRNLLILTDSAGRTGVGEVPGGEKIRQTLEDAREVMAEFRRATSLPTDAGPGDHRRVSPAVLPPHPPHRRQTMHNDASIARRRFLKSAAGTGLALTGGLAGAQSFDFKPNQRYPDPAVQILDPSFAKYRIYSSTIEQVGTGMRWAEGPVYFPEGGYLLVSDIPNNRIMKYSEKDGSFSVFRSNANYANGNARDRQGRLVSCEHSVTRRITRTERDGKITVLADSFEGKKLNAPNDIVVKSDDSIWFTDPLFGISGEWEGSRAKPEQASTNVYRIAADGKISAVLTDLVNPNGLAFSPDEKKLYIVEWKGTPNRSIWSYEVGTDGFTLSNKTKLIDAADQGALDGFRVDRDGNLWCGWGSNGALEAEPVSDVSGRKVHLLKGKPEDLDGVRVFSPQGKPLAHIRLPERCANLCFGGPKNNRLYMASCHSVYALYVEAHGAV